MFELQIWRGERWECWMAYETRTDALDASDCFEHEGFITRVVEVITDSDYNLRGF